MKISLFIILSSAALINDVSSEDSAQRARRGQFKFAASIYSRGLHKCTGAIISLFHIITAARCIYNEHILDLRVIVGSMSVSPLTEWREVQNTHIFNGYEPMTGDNDIGIIQLKQSLAGSDKIRVIPYKETGQNGVIDLECELIWFESPETPSIQKTTQSLWWKRIVMSIENDRRRLYTQPGNYPRHSYIPFNSQHPGNSGAPIVCNRILTAILGTPMTDTVDMAAKVVMIGCYEHWIESKISPFQI